MKSRSKQTLDIIRLLEASNNCIIWFDNVLFTSGSAFLLQPAQVKKKVLLHRIGSES